ncbi:MAG: zf-HC2 domain-containing protein [Cystobacter sp.]
MKAPCRESDLDALLAGELPAEDAGRVETHAAGCATCARTLAWLKVERGWMAQRARHQTPRRALATGAWEARLGAAPVAPSFWSREWRRGVWAAAALAACVTLGLLMPSSVPNRPEEPWTEGLMSMARVEACLDPGIEAMARVEARVGACLVASPAGPSWASVSREVGSP